MYLIHKEHLLNHERSSAGKTTRRPESRYISSLGDMTYIKDEGAEPSLQLTRRLSTPGKSQGSGLQMALDHHAEKLEGYHFAGAHSLQELVSTQQWSDKNIKCSLPWSEDALPLHQRLSRLQDKYFVAHIKLNEERQDIRFELAHLKQSISCVAQMMNTKRVSKDKTSDDVQRKNAYNEFIADRQAFESKMKAIEHHEERHSKMEFKISKIQTEFLRIIASYFTGGGQEDEEATSSDSSYSDPSFIVLHPLVEQYDTLHSEVRELHDRLSDHLVRALEPSDDRLAYDDEAFAGVPYTDWWRNEFDAIWDDIWRAEEDLIGLWQECQKSGVDLRKPHLEIPRHVTESGTLVPAGGGMESRASYLWNLGKILPDWSQGLEWLNLDGRIAHRIDEICQFAVKQDFIKSWVGKVPLDPNPLDSGPAELKVRTKHRNGDVYQSTVGPNCNETFDSRSAELAGDRVSLLFPNDDTARLDGKVQSYSRELDSKSAAGIEGNGASGVRRSDDVADEPVMVPRDDKMAPNGHPLSVRDTKALNRAVRRLKSVRSDSELHPGRRFGLSTLTRLSDFHRRESNPA